MKNPIARRWVMAVAAVLVALPGTLQAQSGTVLFQEGFEDTRYASRGWYDTTGGALSFDEKHAGSSALECRFAVADTRCAGKTPGRHIFQASESVYVSYYVKYSANWVGSGRPYHPHMFLVMTNADDPYIGPAYTHLTAYIEENAGIPQLLIQDGRNVDEARIGRDLTNVTERRAVAGCNGDGDGYGDGDCYASGAVHWNGKKWSAAQVYFDNVPHSARYKGDWHMVEAYFELNTVANGRSVRDGIVRYWYDGALVLDRPNVVMRTAAQPTMRFNQFQIAPWIGDGSPVDQTVWIDDLLVATARPASPPAPPTTVGVLP